MGFDTEPTGFEKTARSDLQGAWQCLRREVADNPGFDGWDPALFHADETMNWEGSVAFISLNTIHRGHHCVIATTGGVFGN